MYKLNLTSDETQAIIDSLKDSITKDSILISDREFMRDTLDNIILQKDYIDKDLDITYRLFLDKNNLFETDDVNKLFDLLYIINWFYLERCRIIVQGKKHFGYAFYLRDYTLKALRKELEKYANNI